MISNGFIPLGFLTTLLFMGAATGAANPVNDRFGCEPLPVSEMNVSQIEGAIGIQDPLFSNLPVRNMFHKEKQPASDKPGDSDPKNIHSLFRKEIKLQDKPISSASLFITTDDYYKAYINGAFVGQGPAPAYLFEYPFNGWDVTDVLKNGEENCLAVHTYYQGLVNRVWCSGDNRAGLLCKLIVNYQDGSRDILVSDPNWRVLWCQADSGTIDTGYDTQFLEDIDLRLWPHGWDCPGFDDSDWSLAARIPDEIVFEYNIVPQDTPPIFIHRVSPINIKKIETGRYFIDMGRELVGHTSLRLSGPEGHRIEIRHAEELEGENEIRYKMRANCVYQDFITLSGRKNETIYIIRLQSVPIYRIIKLARRINSQRFLGVGTSF